MGHRDPRMTLRVYTDVTGARPQTRLAGLLGAGDWAPLGTKVDLGASDASDGEGTKPLKGPISRASGNGSDGTRTRDLRRDRPAL